MSSNDRLETYIRLVEFLGKSLGPNYEVFLYDLRREEHPIVAIANGNLSGRRVGSLMKNVIVKMLDRETTDPDDKDLLIRHDAVSRDGKQFKSSTMLLRDEEGQPIGALCINFNVDAVLGFKEFLEGLGGDIAQTQRINVEEVIFAGEVFSEDKIVSLDALFDHVMEVTGDFDVDRPKDRQRFVDEFYREGGFQQKGAVPFLATRLCISEPTVYRYLSKARQEVKHSKEES